MLNQSESALARVSRQLTQLEKRGWEGWVVVSLTGILVSIGLLAISVPAAFKGDTIHFEITASRLLAFGLFVLLALLNTCLVTKRFEVRRLREQLISSTLQNQVTEQQSFIDPLTEIYNRRSLDRVAGQFISQARWLGNPLTFLMIDVDRFKQVNTRFGHLTGDFVLAEIAGLLRVSTRGSDAVVRYGGDEFLILLADARTEGARRVIDRINGRLEERNGAGHLEGFEVRLVSALRNGRTGRPSMKFSTEPTKRCTSTSLPLLLLRRPVLKLPCTSEVLYNFGERISRLLHSRGNVKQAIFLRVC